MTETPKLRSCLVCGAMRMSTRANRIHERCADADQTRGVMFTAAENRRINEYLQAHARPGAAKRGPKPKPLPTEAEVQTMTAAQRVKLRSRYQRRGLTIPAYLAPQPQPWRAPSP